MTILLVICYFIDIFVHLSLLVFFWRMLKGIKIIKNNKSDEKLKPVNRKTLVCFQILSVVIVVVLALIVTYRSSSPFFGDFLLMLLLYLVMPMHGGILLLSIVMHHTYNRKVRTFCNPLNGYKET